MSSLSDLLPAGGGGKNVDFVASGALGNGVAVTLKSDGTVGLPINQSLALSSPVGYRTGAMMRNAAAYDSGENKIISVFADNLGTIGLTVKLGSLSGSTVTWQTRVTVVGYNFNPDILSIASNNNGTFVVAYNDDTNSANTYVAVGTISGTTVTMGTPVTLGTTNAAGCSVSYDASASKFIVFYANGSMYGTAVVLSISGTTPTINTPVIFDSTTGGKYTSAYDSINQKTGLLYYKSTSESYGIATTISGTTPSFGAVTTLAHGLYTETNFQPSGTFDSDSGQCIFAFSDDQNSGRGAAITMKITGTSVSFGTAVTFTSGTDSGYWPTVSYDSLAKKVVIIYDAGDNQDGNYVTGTVSGTSITVASPIQFSSTQIKATATVFDSAAGKSVFTYIDEGNGDDLYYVVLANAAQTVDDFIGITDAAISDAASGSVTIKGGISTNVTSLTPNSIYYVQADGSISTVSTSPAVRIGRAFSSTSINLEFTT